jgi:hypothetical protein
VSDLYRAAETNLLAVKTAAVLKAITGRPYELASGAAVDLHGFEIAPSASRTGYVQVWYFAEYATPWTADDMRVIEHFGSKYGYYAPLPV